MPETAADPAPTRRRLALPLTLGLALWGWGHYVLSLPGAFGGDEGTFTTWALATQWVLVNAGLVLALVCGHRLARRLGAHLVTRDQGAQLEQPAPTGPRRRSPAIALIAGGAALGALSELQWLFLAPGDTIPAAVGVATAIIAVLAPTTITLGIYLALRRLEDHLDGKRPDQASTAPPSGGRPHASGLTRPYVII